MITIAIGLGENKNILKAIELFKLKNNCNIIICDNDTDLINCINDKNVDIVIRGSLSSNNILKNLKNYNKNISRASYIKKDDFEFLLSPVGIDEGKNVEEKYEIVKNCEKFIKNLNKEPKIAILANGRKDDLGRSLEIDNSINESEKLYNLIKKNSASNLKNYYILIEEAIKDENNIIIAPNGIIGNILFRSFVLVNKWPSYGAITFGLNKVYIDTSRSQTIEGYLRSLNLGYKILIDRLNKNN
ncbi:MAG: methanogenesis marker protein Mmp4/MtxX [Methanobacteriaceae archaeon]|nr:methanogenesis marker protein Mmp4/MtxX [Methanobacteriaceae archaeon]